MATSWARAANAASGAHYLTWFPIAISAGVLEVPGYLWRI